MSRKLSMILAGSMFYILAGQANAGLLSCDSTDGTVTRTWTFNSATACDTGAGNPNSSSDIENLGGAFSGTTWTKEGDVTDSGDDSSLLDVTLTSGSWGGKDIEATWTLVADFWQRFESAVFTVHVGGNHRRAPDDFGAFVIETGQLSGTWSFLQTSTQNGGGGGLSNASIWTGPRISVPEPGSLALLALGLIGLLASRRRVF